MDRLDPAPRRTLPVPSLIGRPLEPLYRAVIGWRNRRFDRGVGVTKLGIPVISVGNLSVGGTGKTPMVMHVVSWLLRESSAADPIRPCIAMRGYAPGRKRGLDAPVSDEADVYRRVLPDVPVVAQPDRAAGIRRLLRGDVGERPTCVVLDDGFQHRRLARDLDIVLIDASRRSLSDRLLPAGWLREPPASLHRAGLVVLTHAEMVDADEIARIEAGVRRASGRGVDAVTRHVWTGLVTSGERGDRLLPLDWLLGKRVVGCCAIGNPHGFMHALRATLSADAGCEGTLVGAMVLPDHDPFGPEVVRALAATARDERAEAIVVTDKDWSKLRRTPIESWHGIPIVRPMLSMVFERGRLEFDARIVRIARWAIDSPSA